MKNKSALLDTRENRIGIATAIQRHLDMNGIARKELIRDHLSKGTLEKVFQGEFSERTLTKIEAALKTSFIAKGGDENQAPKRLGGYTFQSVEALLGIYICVRPMFNGSADLNAYIIQIDWNKSER